MSVTMLSPDQLMAEGTLHSSLHYPVGTEDFYLELICYFCYRIDADLAEQICRLMVVLYQLPILDEQISLIANAVLNGKLDD
jgi:hypothetical protein